MFSDRSKSTSRPESRGSSISQDNSLKGEKDLDSDKAERFTKTIVEEFTVNVDSQVIYLHIFIYGSIKKN